MRLNNALAVSLGFLSAALSASPNTEEAQAIKRLASNILRGLYLVEFEDGHVRLLLPFPLFEVF